MAARTRKDHAVAALRLLAKAEGEARCSAVGDIGVPERLVSAVELIRLARQAIAEVFNVRATPVILPSDAP